MAFDPKTAFGKVAWNDSTRAQALYAGELALWAALSDGEIDDREMSVIAQALTQVPALSAFTPAKVQQVTRDCLQFIKDEEKLRSRMKGLCSKITDSELRKATYQFAAFCASRDGEFTPWELQFLIRLQKRLKIADLTAKELVAEVLT